MARRRSSRSYRSTYTRTVYVPRNVYIDQPSLYSGPEPGARGRPLSANAKVSRARAVPQKMGRRYLPSGRSYVYAPKRISRSRRKLVQALFNKSGGGGSRRYGKRRCR